MHYHTRKSREWAISSLYLHIVFREDALRRYLATYSSVRNCSLHLQAFRLKCIHCSSPAQELHVPLVISGYRNARGCYGLRVYEYIEMGNSRNAYRISASRYLSRRLQVTDSTRRFNFRQGQCISSSPQNPDRLWRPPSLLYNV
jgi:hypothetical protein